MKNKINNYIRDVKKILNVQGSLNKINILENFKIYLDRHRHTITIDDLNTTYFDLLIYSIKSNCPISVIKYLLENCQKYRSCLNYETKENEIPLFIALKKAIPKTDVIFKNGEKTSFYLIQDYIMIFNLLEDYGADINFCNRKNENLLLYLYNQDLLNEEIFRILYHKKININYFLEMLYNVSREGENPDELINNHTNNFHSNHNYIYNKNNFIKYLHIAINEYHKNVEEFLICLLQQSNNHIKRSNEQIIKLIKEEMIDNIVQIPFEYLHDLVEKNKIQEIQKLINHHVEIYYKNYPKNIKKNSNSKLLKYLKKFNSVNRNIYNTHFNTKEILSSCFLKNEYNIIDFLVQQGVDLDEYDNNNYLSKPLLIEACQQQNMRTIKYLIEHHADISIKDSFEGKSGLTHLIEDFDNGHTNVIEIIKYLLDHGATFCNDYFSSINYLKKEENTDFYLYLIEYGANIYYELKNSLNNDQKFKYILDYDDIKNHHCCVPIEELVKTNNFEMIYYIIHKFENNVNIIDFDNKSLLMIAYKEGKKDLVNYLIKHNADPTIHSEEGESLLMLACKQKDFEMVKYLIEKGINPNECSTQHNTPLIHSFPDLKLVKYLIDHGADINQTDNFGMSPIVVACINGYKEIVEYFLTKENINIESNNFYNSPISVAIENSNWDIVNILDNRKYYLNKHALVSNQYYPLHHYCLKGDFEMVQELIKKGLNVNEPDDYGYTPLMKACIGDNDNGQKTVEYLVTNGADINISNNSEYTALMFSVENEKLDLVKYLLSHHASINNRARYGMTELMMACKTNSLEIIKELITYGVDVNAVNIYGYTALMYACQRQHENSPIIIKYLVENKAQINVYNPMGYSPLFYACHYHSLETISYLIDHDGDILVTTTDNTSALTIVSGRNDIELVKYILNQGVNINLLNQSGYSPIIYACEHDNFEIVKCLIDHGANVNQNGYEGNTPLLLACKNNNLEMAQYLMEHGANINDYNKNKNNSLLLACENDCNLKLVEYLIECGIDINKQNKLGETALTIISKKNNIEIIEYLLSQNANINQRNNLNGNNNTIALVYACQQNNIPLVKCLIDYGADINIKCNENEETLLMIASQQEDSLELVQYLISHGADVNKKSKIGNTALMMACERNYFNIIQLLVDNNADINHHNRYGRTAIIKACENNNTEIVNYLLQSGASIENDYDTFKKSLLMIACEQGNLDMVKCLIHYGIDIDEEDAKGRTALMYACHRKNNNNYDIVNYLIEQKADIHTISKYGFTALSYACKNGDEKKVKLLLQHNSIIGVSGKYGETELILACKCNNIEIVKDLIKYKPDFIDVNIKDNSGNTGLMYACEQGNSELVTYLIQHNAKIKDCNDYGYQPFMFACKNGNLQIIERLMEYNIDINYQAKDGMTALMIACDYHHLEVVKYLVNQFNNINVNQWDIKGRTALVHSLIKGYFDITQFLIEQAHADLFTYDVFGISAMTYAIRATHLETMQYLMKHNLIVKNHINYRVEGLLDACQNNQIYLVQHLIEHGANINVTDDTGKSGLMYACKNCNMELVKYLIDHGADINCVDDDMMTTLHFLIENLTMITGQQNESEEDWNENEKVKEIFEIIKYLIENGADVDTVNDYGQTILMFACKSNHLKMVQYLVEKGIQINATDNNNDTALILSCKYNNYVIAKYLVEKGAQINIITSYKYTALTYACDNNNLKLVKLLIKENNNNNENSSNQRNQNNNGGNHDNDIEEIILQHVLESKNVDIMKCLIEQGHMNISLLNHSNYQELGFSPSNMDFELVKYLLEHGFEVNKKDSHGWTILMYACERGQKDKVQYLIDNRHANVNITNKIGQNALMIASKKGFMSIIKILLEHKAEIDVRDSSGNTSQIYAYENGHYDVVNYLLDHSHISYDDNDDMTNLNLYHVFKIPQALINISLFSYLINNKASINLSKENDFIIYMKFKRNKVRKRNSNTNSNNNSQIQKWLLKKDKYENEEETKYIFSILQPPSKTLLLQYCLREDININILNYLLNQYQELSLNIDQYDENKERSALSVACEKGNIILVKLLVDKGANINSCNEAGDSVLMRACKYGKMVIIQYLIKQGVNIHHKNKSGQSALTYAYHHNNWNILLYLLNHKADIKYLLNEINSLTLVDNKNIPYKLYTLLIDSNIEINDQNDYGNTPLIEACIENNYIKVKYLIDHGARIDINNHFGGTALSYACERGHKEIVQYILENGTYRNNYNEVDNILTSDKKRNIITSKLDEISIMTAYKHHHYFLVKYLIERWKNDYFENQNEWKESLIKKLNDYNNCNNEFLKIL